MIFASMDKDELLMDILSSLRKNFALEPGFKGLVQSICLIERKMIPAKLRGQIIENFAVARVLTPMAQTPRGTGTHDRESCRKLKRQAPRRRIDWQAVRTADKSVPTMQPCRNV